MAKEFFAHEMDEYRRVVAAWNRRLAQLDGDPSTHEWNAFRPLRVSREEDWSDWLAHLLETASSDEFARGLFPRENVVPRVNVQREVAAEDWRADLVIHWGASHTHVEVKVGDEHFAKTEQTALALETASIGSWTHYLLLPSGDLARANDALGKSTVTIHKLTWEQVASALRRALLSKLENVRWRAFAHAFCGAIEQQLLKYPRDPVKTLSQLAARKQQLDLMNGAWIDE